MKQFALTVIIIGLSFNSIFSNSNVVDECYIYDYIEDCEKQAYDYDLYRTRMAVLESSSSYTALNQFGYLGMYQFGRSTLKGLRRSGYLKISNREMITKNFLSNPELQERAMKALTDHNIKVLTRYGLMKYIGSEVKGVEVTLSGMLAASHLVGPNAVKKLIKSNGIINKADGNGTTALKYLNEFV